MPAPRPSRRLLPRSRGHAAPVHAPVPARDTARETSQDTVGDLIRWAVFSCVLVPVVLVWYGTSLAGATGAALGLAGITAACRALLRRSERHAAHETREAHASRTAPAAHGAHPSRPAHPAPAQDRHHIHTGTPQGAHRGGRRPRRNAPVD